MPQILVAGAATGCWTNLGDEAILAGMAASLRAAIPGAELVVVSSSPAGFFERDGCGEVRYDDIDALAAAVHASDLVLIGGGSIFFDYWGCDPSAVLTPAHQGLSLWASVALLAANAEVPLMGYGAGIGPLRTADGELLARVVFELASDVAVRDTDSARTLHALTDGTVDAVVTGDPALAVALTSPLEIDATPPVVGIAVRPWEVDVEPERWPVELAGALDAFLAETGGSAVFVPCHRSVAWPLTDDTAAAESVRAAMTQADRTQIVSVDLPWAERAALLASVDLVVAMRYHASLFALAAGVPAVGLIYDPKIAGLFSDWGFARLAVTLDELTTAAVLDRLRQAFVERDTWSDRARHAATIAREREPVSATRAAALLAAGPVSSALGGVSPTIGAATRALSERLSGGVPAGGVADLVSRRLASALARP